MASKQYDGIQAYVLTAAGECTVTLTIGKKQVTWTPLRRGGQTMVIIPAKGDYTLSDPKAVMTPAPFKVALGTIGGGAGGETDETFAPDSEFAMSGAAVAEALTYGLTECNSAPGENEDLLPIQHNVYACMQPGQRALRVQPGKANRWHAMQLMLTPSTQLPQGWMTATDGAEVLWPNGGEPTFVQGYTYIVTLVQVSPTRILANISAMY